MESFKFVVTYSFTNNEPREALKKRLIDELGFINERDQSTLVYPIKGHLILESLKKQINSSVSVEGVIEKLVKGDFVDIYYPEIVDDKPVILRHPMTRQE